MATPEPAADASSAAGHYILTMRDDRYWLVGPFPSRAAAGNWGFQYAGDPEGARDGDPRWQVLELAAAFMAPFICTPDRARAIYAHGITPPEHAYTHAKLPPPGEAPPQSNVLDIHLLTVLDGEIFLTGPFGTGEAAAGWARAHSDHLTPSDLQFVATLRRDVPSDAVVIKSRMPDEAGWLYGHRHEPAPIRANPRAAHIQAITDLLARRTFTQPYLRTLAMVVRDLITGPTTRADHLLAAADGIKDTVRTMKLCDPASFRDWEIADITHLMHLLIVAAPAWANGGAA